jgi:hypothetical protein
MVRQWNMLLACHTTFTCSLPQAAMAMQAYSDWAPKEFDEDAIGKEAPQPAAGAAAAAGGSALAGMTDGAAAVDGTAAAANGTAAAASDGATQQQAAQFEYDPATGD